MNLKQLKFSLAVVINILTAITFGYYCFLGENFRTMGDKEKSIISAAVIILLLIGTSLGAKKLKQTKRNCKKCLIWEIVLLFFFTSITAYSTYSYFSHYFVVSAKESEIKRKLIGNISEVEKMYPDYKTYVETRVNIYKNKLSAAILNKNGQQRELNNFGMDINGTVSLEIQKNNQLAKINYKLLPQNFDLIKTTDSTYFAKAKVSINNWEPISLVDVINNIGTNTTSSLNKLVSFSKDKARGEEGYPDFIPSTPTLHNVKNYFTTIGTPSPFSILLAIIGYILMLLSWYVTKRDSRCTGALTTADYEVVL